MKRFVSFLLILCTLILLPSCNKGNVNNTDDISSTGTPEEKYKNTYVDVEYVEKAAEGLTWPEGQALPSFATPVDNLDAIDVRSRANSKHISMLSSLAGLINKKQPRIYVYHSSKWLKDIGLTYNDPTKDIEALVLKYKDEIEGLIVWDTNVPDTINLATTMAGLKNAMVVNEEELATYSAGDFSFPIIEDLRGKFSNKLEVYNYLYDNLWQDCTKRLIIGIKVADKNTMDWQLRDLAVASKAAVVWLNTKNAKEKELMKKFMSDCTPGETTYCGWWDDEGAGVALGTEFGVPTVPSDYYNNYSVFAGTSRELDIPTVPAKPELENKYYIAFTLSDGDNMMYVQGPMKDASQLWPSKQRGKTPISWTCSSALLDAGPQILNYYYKTATENDLLISGPSGLGYSSLENWKEEATASLIKYTQKTDSYFRRTGMSIITVWNKIRNDQSSIYAENIRSLVGFTVQERLSGQSGQEIINGTTPLLTTDPRYDGDIPRVLYFLKDGIENWDGNSPAFRMPQIIAFEITGGAPGITNMANTLKKKYGDKVEFVRADHLMMLYREANNLPYNVSLQSQNVSASGSDEDYPVSQIVDGSFAKSKGWQSSAEGDKWVVIDLQVEYTLSRYIVKNAASGYYSKDLNTVDFKIQASNDGSEWTDIDAVYGNTSDIVDKDVEKFDARYVRLLITNPGADGVARIQDFEIHGNKK